MTNDVWVDLLKKEMDRERQVWSGLSSTDSRRVLGELRDKHFAQFLQKRFPPGADRWWQFTHVQDIVHNIFQNVVLNSVSDSCYFNEKLVSDFPNVDRLHFQNGQLVKSEVSDGLQWCTWDQLNVDFPCWSWVIDCFSREKNKDKDGFFHLAGSFPKGYILFVPEGYESSRALHIHSTFNDLQGCDKHESPHLKDSLKSSDMRFAAEHGESPRSAVKAELALSKSFKQGDSHHLQKRDNNVNAAASKSLPLGGWNFIFMGKGARLTLVESISHQGQILVNKISNVQHCEHSVLRWIRVEEGDGYSCYLNQSISEMEREASLDRFHFSLGSKFSRDRVDVTHKGEKARSVLLGLSILQNKNQSDHRFNVHHLKQGGYSRQFYRGILNNESKGIFHGRVHIESCAENVDCSQSAKNLLLSNRACSCIQPELAIDCSEVQAQHGAAVGSLNPDEIFYLQARGLDKQSALELLIFAYIRDVLSRFPSDDHLEYLSQVIHDNRSILLNLVNKG